MLVQSIVRQTLGVKRHMVKSVEESEVGLTVHSDLHQGCGCLAVCVARWAVFGTGFVRVRGSTFRCGEYRPRWCTRRPGFRAQRAGR